jgi:hypothetical protein
MSAGAAPVAGEQSHTGRGGVEHWLNEHADLFAALVVLLGFVLRLWAASGTFLNPDEALHFLIANKPSWSAAYRASLYSAHPPLLIFVLYFWRALGTSELLLRLPSVLAGTAFCWITYKWIAMVLDRFVALAGVVLLAFLPPLIALSSEVRQYALLLFFMSAALLLLEKALQRSSSLMMILSAACTYLTMLTHYSALLFAAAVAAYALVRIATRRPSAKLLATWIIGQFSVAALFVFLYRTQIAPLRASAASNAVQGWLYNSFYHSGQDNPFLFVVARSFGTFQFTMGQLIIGDLAALLFLFGVFVLIRRNSRCRTHSRLSASKWVLPSGRELALLLILPFALNCATAFAGLYPYGGTRHSAFLVLFAVAGVAYGLDWISRERITVSGSIAFALVILCAILGSPHRPYITRADQRIAHMTDAMQAIQSQVPARGSILVDYQSSRLLGRYLCGDAAMKYDLSHPQLQIFTCAGIRVISSEPDTLVFTPGTFKSTLKRAVAELNLPPQQPVWVFQGGWDIQLGDQLQKNPDLRGLSIESFGHNLQIFRLTAAQRFDGESPSARNVTSSGVARPFASLVTTPNPPL